MYNSIAFNGFDGKGLRTTKMDGEISLEFLTGFNSPLEIFCLPFVAPRGGSCIRERAYACTHARALTRLQLKGNVRSCGFLVILSLLLFWSVSFFILSLFFSFSFLRKMASLLVWRLLQSIFEGNEFTMNFEGLCSYGTFRYDGFQIS